MAKRKVPDKNPYPNYKTPEDDRVEHVEMETKEWAGRFKESTVVSDRPDAACGSI